MKKALVALSVATALGLAGTAHATSFNHQGWYLTAGYTGYHIHYKEDITPSDKDTGWLNGFNIEFGKVGSTFWHKLRVQYATTGKHQGNYDGASQDGAGYYASLSTDTSEYILNVEAENGIYQKWKNNLYTYEGIIYGVRYWRRSIEDGVDSNGYPVKGFVEKYTDWYAGLNVGVQYTIPRWTVGIDVSGAIAPRGEAFTHMDSTNPLTDEDVTYNMGTAYMFRVSLPVEFDITKSLKLDLSPFYEHWKFDESNTVSLGSGLYAVEPHSNTDELGFNLNITYVF